MKSWTRPLPTLVAACLAATLLHPLAARADPMRPLVLPSAASAPPGSAAPRLRTPDAGEAPPVREPERLVAIRQDSQQRWQALFGERWVSSGDKVENYTVGVIDANSVQLADARQKKKLLHLLPALQPAGTTEIAQASAAPTAHRAIGLP